MTDRGQFSQVCNYHRAYYTCTSQETFNKLSQDQQVEQDSVTTLMRDSFTFYYPLYR